MAWNHGRKIKVAKGPRDCRNMIREHFRDARLTLTHDLARIWGIHHNSVARVLYSRERPLSPGYVEAVITALKLDEFDANELRMQGALEAGWKIDTNFLLKDVA